MKTRNAILFATMLAAGVAFAAEPVNKTLLGGYAVKGVDVVAYHTDGAVVKGSKSLAFEWRGAKWLFASEAHRAAFKGAPERFAPQYGGYCAWAMSQGKTADIDPEAWKIVDGKLYLNYDKEIQSRWE